jgi:hypothetical protein
VAPCVSAESRVTTVAVAHIGLDPLDCSSWQAASSEATSFFRLSIVSSIAFSSCMSIFSY